MTPLGWIILWWLLSSFFSAGVFNHVFEKKRPCYVSKAEILLEAWALGFFISLTFVGPIGALMFAYLQDEIGWELPFSKYMFGEW